jgi:hypothetical protein
MSRAERVGRPGSVGPAGRWSGGLGERYAELLLGNDCPTPHGDVPLH